MTLRQNLLKLVYPLWMKISKLSASRSKILINQKDNFPAESFYDLSVELIDGRQLDFNTLKGRKVLLVNTASDCGFTKQYEELQKLYSENSQQLMIIAFPANDFKKQEKGTDEQIEQFCKENYNISFPLAKKSTVIRSPRQNEVFKWLTDKTKNGWTNKQPSWNFSKWLVNEQGILTHYFDPAISPLGKEFREAIGRRDKFGGLRHF